MVRMLGSSNEMADSSWCAITLQWYQAKSLTLLKYFDCKVLILLIEIVLRWTMVYTARALIPPVSAECNNMLIASDEKYFFVLSWQVSLSHVRSQNFSELKSRLSVAWRAEKSLEETWPSLLQRLRRRLESLRGADSVPSVHLKHIRNNGGNLPAAALDKVEINMV